MREYIEAQIAKRRQTINGLHHDRDRIDRQCSEVEAEVRAYEDILSHLPNSAGRAPRRPARAGGGGKMRNSNWRVVFEHIAAQWPQPVTTDAMLRHAEVSGLPLTRQAIRAQTSGYTQKGSLERVKTGLYRMTPKGAAELGIELQEKGAAAPGLLEESAADSTQHDAESGRVVAG
jgi:hypothetical protein